MTGPCCLSSVMDEFCMKITRDKNGTSLLVTWDIDSVNKTNILLAFVIKQSSSSSSIPNFMRVNVAIASCGNIKGPRLYLTFFEHVSVLNSQSVLRNDVTLYALARWVWDLFWVEFVFFFGLCLIISSLSIHASWCYPSTPDSVFLSFSTLTHPLPSVFHHIYLITVMWSTFTQSSLWASCTFLDISSTFILPLIVPIPYSIHLFLTPTIFSTSLFLPLISQPAMSRPTYIIADLKR